MNIRVIYKLSNEAVVTVVNADDGSTYYNELTCGALEGTFQDVLGEAVARGMNIEPIEEFINTHIE